MIFKNYFSIPKNFLYLYMKASGLLSKEEKGRRRAMRSHNVTIVITDDLRAKYPDGAEVFETKFSGKAQFVVGAVDYFVRKSRSQLIVSGPGSINYFVFRTVRKFGSFMDLYS